jgi:hypothetical protein
VSEVKVLPPERIGHNFIPPEYLPPGEDEFYLRNRQSSRGDGAWRQLRAQEIEVLVKNGNTCDDWDWLLVTDPFTPFLVKSCEFHGLVRIGRLERVILEHHDLKLPAGIADSLVISCDLGDNVAIRNVRYLAHFLVGDNVILLNVDEMNTTDHAKFGNGIVKQGEPEEVRIWIDLMNEAGGRSVMPFDGMISADAYLWAKYRDDRALVQRLGEITQRQFDARRGYYGVVGDQSVIKNSRIIKDVKIGSHAYIKGANKLKNLTINSSRAEPAQIGEGVELVNGIIGLGCSVFYGCKAVRFVMGNNCQLKYGARLIHSCLGDNSTVSCCEILNNLIFPAHEQHHNNSFLTASLVMGQSNLAAGATIGSNHNSRANDGEIQAGRGFWPGLCTTLKHSSRFASFTLLAKGDYPAELDVRLPFALVSDDVAHNRLQVLPAFWWLYNMYALARNSWKFQSRDLRKTKTQHVEFDFLAPDTIEEIFDALRLLEIWTDQAWLRAAAANAQAGVAAAANLQSYGRSVSPGGHAGKPHENLDDDLLARQGRQLLLAGEGETSALEVLGYRVENSSRKAVILKVRRAYHAYRQMLHYYAVKNLLDYLESRPEATRATMVEHLAGPRCRAWVNLGGQLAPAESVAALREGIGAGRLSSWPEIHAVYDRLWQEYPLEKQKHAYATLLAVLDAEKLTADLWKAALDEFLRIQEHVRDQVFLSRKKDYDDPFRRITFDSEAELRAVLGSPECNGFVKHVRQETEALAGLCGAIAARG